jgi:hypothetical protein
LWFLQDFITFVTEYGISVVVDTLKLTLTKYVFDMSKSNIKQSSHINAGAPMSDAGTHPRSESCDDDIQSNVQGTRQTYSTNATELQQYKELINHLAETKSTQFYTNGDKEHAEIILSTIFSHTKKILRIYRMGNNNGFTSAPPYKDALLNALAPKNTDDSSTEPFLITCLILVHNTEDPLFDDINGCSNVTILKITDDATEHIKQNISLQNKNVNFAIGDDDMFRLEIEPTQYKAIGSFNNKPITKRLIELFDEAFEMSRPTMDR